MSRNTQGMHPLCNDYRLEIDISLARDQWAAWFDPRVPVADVLKWLPEGRLDVEQVYGKPPTQGVLTL